jgi:hypothetical protein
MKLRVWQLLLALILIGIVVAYLSGCASGIVPVTTSTTFSMTNLNDESALIQTYIITAEGKVNNHLDRPIFPKRFILTNGSKTLKVFGSMTPSVISAGSSANYRIISQPLHLSLPLTVHPALQITWEIPTKDQMIPVE